MVVDGHAAARMMICSQLRTLGHEALTCAHDWKSALARLKVEPIDIVFLDVESANGGGIKALAAIRSDAVLHPLPVVLITTRAERETVEASLALGVSGYLVKPPSVAAISACLRRALA